MKKVRLDQLVFDLGLAESRERAKTTVMAGLVYVNGQKSDKPGTQVSPDAKIEVRGDALPYVSRGGFKLEKALKVFPVDPTGYTCLEQDILLPAYEGMLAVGDYIVFENTGGYSTVLKPPFIRPNCAMITEKAEGEYILIKKSETYEDIFHSYLY